MFRGSVKDTGYPLHSHVSPSLPLQCVTVCRQVSTESYILRVVTAKDVPKLDKEFPKSSSSVKIDVITRISAPSCLRLIVWRLIHVASDSYHSVWTGVV